MGRIMISLRSTNHASTSADTDSSKVLAALTLMALSLYDGEHNYPFAKLKLDARYASYLTEGSSGLTFAVDRFKGWEHSGHVTLARGERSRLADYAADVL